MTTLIICHHPPRHINEVSGLQRGLDYFHKIVVRLWSRVGEYRRLSHELRKGVKRRHGYLASACSCKTWKKTMVSIFFPTRSISEHGFNRRYTFKGLGSTYRIYFQGKWQIGG
nr:hypothetical protein [Tanacetum cinerariifolium]